MDRGRVPAIISSCINMVSASSTTQARRVSGRRHHGADDGDSGDIDAQIDLR